MKVKYQIEEKVFSYIREHHMLKPGDRVVAGISGGADSVCLLFVLLEWAKVCPLELAIVHVNHGIRKEAGEDAAYVKSLCEAHCLPFYLVEKDVRERAEQEKCSEEEAGRKTRYEAFEAVAKEIGADYIAVAHNSNDRSETMLFHLFRGSGIKGLGSIQPVRDNIIRPILCLERKEIEAYLEDRGITYCQDATNATDDYTRNRIRHHILPYAEEHVVQGAIAHMARSAEMLSETEDYLEQQTRMELQRCATENEAGYEISVEAYLACHPVLQKRILHTIVKGLSPHQKDISYVHIADLRGLFTKTGNRSVDLPFGIRGKREYDKVSVGIVNEEEFLPVEECELQFTLLDADFSHKIGEEVPQNQYTKWFDYDKIKGCLTVRTRNTGDYLTIADGAGGMRHKTLKDYMIAAKIPKDTRDRIPVLSEGSHVLWLVGYRISEYYKISENTKRILQVQLIKKTIINK